MMMIIIMMMIGTVATMVVVEEERRDVRTMGLIMHSVTQLDAVTLRMGGAGLMIVLVRAQEEEEEEEDLHHTLQQTLQQTLQRTLQQTLLLTLLLPPPVKAAAHLMTVSVLGTKLRQVTTLTGP
jgi:hypothetical protein